MYGKEWTNEEIEFMKSNYTKYGPTYCSKHLDRPYHSVMNKARKLSLSFQGYSEKYNKENLEEVVKNSKSLGQVADKIGVSVTGNMYKVIRKYIDLHGIDTSHFEPNKLGGVKKKPLEEIMVENSTYRSTHLKRRLINEGYFEYKCAECGNGGEWNGKFLSLHLDHINGVNNDHRYENLRFLCPNCHSQTETYCGKHNKSINPDKKYRKDYCGCGNLKNIYSNKCLDCSNKEKGDKVRKIEERPSYEQLINEVNEIGYLATGRKYGVSDNAVRKWMKRYEEEMT